MSQLIRIHSALHTVIENSKYGYKKFVNSIRLTQQKRQTRSGVE